MKMSGKNTNRNNIVDIWSSQLTLKKKELLDSSKGNGFGIRVSKLCAGGLDVNFGDPDNDNSSALHLAATNGVKLTTLILIRCGADVNSQNIDGNTPLHLAVMNGKYWVADILLHNKANVNIKNNKGETAKKLGRASKEFSLKALFDKRLLNWFGTERKLDEEELAIHKWAKDGYYLGISMKCVEGIDVNIKNINDSLKTALHYAVLTSKNSEEAVLTLLRCGADLNSRDEDDNTPLHLAILHNKAGAVVLLLCHNADPFIPNKDHKTAYQLAGESENPFIKDTFGSNRYLWYMRHNFTLSVE